MEPNNQLTRTETQPIETIENPAWLMRRASDVAGICREIVLKTSMSIQGRKYVKCEGWMAIATTYGCILSARDVEIIDGGVRAIGEVRRASDGVVLSTAEGFVGDDEPSWYGGGPKNLPKRPMFAIKAMCQTRAMSRAARTAFAFVVVLMDAGLATTPAEEMMGLNENESHHDDSGTLPRETNGNRPPTNPKARNASEPPAISQNAPQANVEPMEGFQGDWREVLAHFPPKYANKKLSELEKGQVWFLASQWNPMIDADGRIKNLKDRMLKLAAKAGLEELEQAEKEQAQER